MDNKEKEERILVSKFQWNEEKQAMLDPENPSIAIESGIIEVLDPLIESGTVLYEDFVMKVCDLFLKEVDNYPDTIEGRKELVKQVYTKLTEFYKKF